MEDELSSFFAEIEEVAKVESNHEIINTENLGNFPTQEVVVASAKPQRVTKTIDIAPINQPPPPPDDDYHNTSAFEQPKAYQFEFPSTETVTTTIVSKSSNTSIPIQNKAFVRTGGGDTWVDDSLNEWPENDYRIFVGDIGKEINSEMLTKAFQHYKSFAKAKVIKQKIETKGRGYGFVSFLGKFSIPLFYKDF